MNFDIGSAYKLRGQKARPNPVFRGKYRGIRIPVAILRTTDWDNFHSMAQLLKDACNSAQLGDVTDTHLQPENMFNGINGWSDNGALRTKFGL
jgi:hypothetical protein